MALKPLDLKKLTESTEKVIALSVGEVRVRRLARAEYIRLLPEIPAEVLPVLTGRETDEERKALNELAIRKEIEWIDSLAPAQKVARRAELIEAIYAAVTRAIIEPVLTVDHVKRLGDEAFLVWDAVQGFWMADAVAEKNGTPEVIVAA